MTRDGTVGRSDATEPNLAFHRDIDPIRMMRTRFAHAITASSPPGLHQQAGHMTASDFCAARQMISCQAKCLGRSFPDTLDSSFVHASLDHLVGAGEKFLRNLDAEGVCCCFRV